MQEIDTETILKCTAIILDSPKAAESGDLDVPSQKHSLQCDNLGKYLLQYQKRSSDQEWRNMVDKHQFTFFKSVGIAVQDVATAAVVYKNAMQKGLGISLDVFDE